MEEFKNSFILADLYLAYRKAKYDAFYDSSHFNAVAFCNYERDLDSNLRHLLRVLNSVEAAWAYGRSHLGGYVYAPKSIGVPAEALNGGLQIRAADPAEEWVNQFELRGRSRAEAEFRLLITPTINLHVISALWILKVGHLFDAALSDLHVYANRVRRVSSPVDFDERVALQPNHDCLGIFSPYFSAYAKWREDGLKVVKGALSSGERVVAVTMDLKKFYHNVSPSFLLRSRFHEALGVRLSAGELKFTSNFVEAINTWYKSTPDYIARPGGAIPVGLSASRVISNVILHEFDALVSKKLKPLYYGRYVDDVFLVIRKPEGVSTGEAFLQFMGQKLSPLAKYNQLPNQAALILDLPYARDSQLEFVGAKQKVFDLSGDHGLDLIEHISDQIRAQSSAHKLLPDLPDSDVEMASRALLATSDVTLQADALRKADVVSVRRLGFALLLRDVEAYANDLAPPVWATMRKSFYRLVKRHLLTPRGFFDYSAYLHRVFGLMVACRDFTEIDTLLDCFESVVALLKSTTTVSTSQRAKFRKCLAYYGGSFLQAAIQASTVERFARWPDLFKRLRRIEKITNTRSQIKTAEILQKLSFRMLISDLGRRPYKHFWIHSQRRPLTGPKVPLDRSVQRVLRVGGVRKFRKYADMQIPYWPALAFPTRPLSLAEITLVAPRTLDEPLRLKKCVFSLRGARVADNQLMGRIPPASTNAGGPAHFLIPDFPKRAPRVVITSFKTSEQQWTKAALLRPDLSLKRYRLIRKLVNQILKDQPKAAYIVFPECSLPRRWAIEIATHLARARISLLAGLEYYYDTKSRALRNDCMISMTTTWPGYPAQVIRLQPKMIPAHHEKAQLQRIRAKALVETTDPHRGLPVYLHGGMFFGVLLCSDLTNIANRKHFQGAVDSLFILEWNSDVKTFSFLIEATAHDIHAFAVQVNNRMYGDSRIRAPYRDEHFRDLVRIKGGVSDYYVVSKINFMPLRSFHRTGNIKDRTFKPLPIGFVISPERKNARSLPQAPMLVKTARKLG